MKKIITAFLVCASYISLSQSKELIILDNNSKKPIDLVHIFYPSLEIGSISNANGKVKIPLSDNEIVVSHINYIEKKITFDILKQKDTLFLTPKSNQLEDVIIYSLDLKKKFKDILENNYFKKYSTKKVVHNCTYKETFSVNDSLSRLFQTQLGWFSKNSLFKNNIVINKQNIINLKSIDYSKRLKLENSLIDSKAGYVGNKLFFKFAHLNLILELLTNLTEDYEIESIQENKNTNTVYFNAILKENGKIIYNHKKSLIVFDKDYKAIKHLKFNMIYNTDFEKSISKIYKTPYKYKTESSILELSFNPLKNGKYSISYYILKLNGIIKTENHIDKVISKQSLFVTESRLGKKIKKGNIDFYKPFYENIPKNLTTKNVKILLTENEKYFLNK